MTVDTSGTVVGYDDYYPYGSVLNGRSYTSSADQRYKFTEKERDGSTGLDYFGARFYDSWRAQWLQVDPMAGKYPAWSPYNYCLNNPLNVLDLQGDSAWTVTRDWNSTDNASFSFYATNKLLLAVAAGEPKTCSQLQYEIIIDYASENGLPLPLKSVSGKVFDPTSDSYHDADGFKKAVTGDGGLRAADVKANTYNVDREDRQAGDMVIITAPWDHIVAYSDRESIVYGNFNSSTKTAVPPVGRPDWTQKAKFSRDGQKMIYYPNNQTVHRWNFLKTEGN